MHFCVWICHNSSTVRLSVSPPENLSKYIATLNYQDNCRGDTSAFPAPGSALITPPAAKPPFSVPRRCKATIDLAVCLEYLSAAPMPAHRERSFPGMFLIPRNRTIRPRAHGHARPLVPHSKAVAAPAKSGKGMPRRIFPDVRDFVEPPRQQWKTTTPDASVRECHNRLQYSFSRNSSRISSIIDGKSLSALPAAQQHAPSGMYSLQRRAAGPAGNRCLRAPCRPGAATGKHSIHGLSSKYLRTCASATAPRRSSRRQSRANCPPET